MKRVFSVLPVLFLLGLNLVLVWPWFGDGYPANNASFEPAIIAQARFIKHYWPRIGWNHLWYLGYPFHFTGAPFLPFLITVLSTFFPSLSLWGAYRLVTGIALVIMPVGVYLGVARFSGYAENAQRSRHSACEPERKVNFATLVGGNFVNPGLLAGLIFSVLPSLLFFFPQVFKIGGQTGFMPWQFFSLAILGKGKNILGLALFPLGLTIFDLYLKNRIKGRFLPTLFVCLLALVDLSSVLTLGILLGLLLISEAIVGKLENKPKRVLEIFIFSFLLLGFIYTPHYWWQVVTSPSLAGKRTLNVLFFLSRSLSIILALVLAVFSVKGFKKRSRLFVFASLWALVFALLTLARFLADYDFWQDYTSWGVELGMGAALLTSCFLTKKFQITSARNRKAQALAGRNFKLQTKRKLKIFGPIFVILVGVSLWFVKKNEFLLPRKNISKNLEFYIVNWLDENVSGNERVYLSGSPVFWLNALVGKKTIPQLRGGEDKAAIHPFWSHASYQIREGGDPELSRQWLKALGVSWIVVHDASSKEPFHDFVYPDKFEKIFQKVFVQEGNLIYKLDASIARQVKEPEKFLSLDSPQDGTDKQALVNYNAYLEGSVSLEIFSPEKMIMTLSENKGSIQAISLAVSCHPRWQAFQGKKRIKIKKDALGQMLVLPLTDEKIILKYKKFGIEQIVGCFLTLIGGLAILKKNKLESNTDNNGDH